MLPKLNLRQSGDFEKFRCIGADCEDTCCGDWGIPIDRKTYDKYQACDDPELRSALHQFVTISPTNGNDEDFARIAQVKNRCPFLADGLCSIQLKLGESYLSNSCALYPRNLVVVDGTVERSLHLSCPEAARLVLLNQGPYEWRLCDPGPQAEVRTNGAPILGSLHANRGGTPYPHFQEIRELCLKVLQAKNYPRWQRLMILARLIEEFSAILNCQQAWDTQAAETDAFIRRTVDTLEAGCFEVSGAGGTNRLLQIETVLELIVARITSDFTTHRFLECYREFMQGIGWGPESTMEEISYRYTEALHQSYLPFINRHEYVLDNFLVNYAIRTVFPYGHRETENKMRIDFVENAVQRQFLLLAVHYAVVRTVLIGMAAFHGSGFNTGHVVKLVQSYAKAFQHSYSFPRKALEILADKGIRTASGGIVLF